MHRNLNENSDLIVKWNATLTKWNGKYGMHRVHLLYYYVDIYKCTVHIAEYRIYWFFLCIIEYVVVRIFFFFWRVPHTLSFDFLHKRKMAIISVIFCFRNHFLKSLWINKQFADRRLENDDRDAVEGIDSNGTMNSDWRYTQLESVSSLIVWRLFSIRVTAYRIMSTCYLKVITRAI